MEEREGRNEDYVLEKRGRIKTWSQREGRIKTWRKEKAGLRLGGKRKQE